ncbi:MAG: Trk family potassium uptake protein [Firmicutes bacterium]|nr:Trk family potassium uptake protein [Bacillota bacterium]
MRLTPAQVLALGFAAVILTGSVLLMLPWTRAPGKITPYIDALFTSTSAVCVTGLVTVDTGSHWSVPGQLIILLLIQVGGLGIMTVSTAFAFLMGKRISLRERLLIQEATGLTQIAGLVRLTRAILIATLIIEGAGAVLLASRFTFDMAPGRAVYFGIFHAISAFCNAGFDLFGRSFMTYVGDWFVNLVVTSLILIGGIGFSVVTELYSTKLGRRGRLSLHSRLALKVTAALLVLGTVLIFAFEYRNPATLSPLPPHAKFLASYFHSVTPRTAGFNTLPTGKMTIPGLLLTIVLMFIGASPGGTGGGIKTTTFATILATVWAIMSGKQDVEIGDRRLTRDVVDRSLAITFISLGLVVLVTTLLTITENALFIEILFEATSAFGTVGLSTGLTPSLSTLGKAFVIIMMFAGRVGPLTLAVAIAQRVHAGQVRLPEDKVLVG